MQLQGPDAGRLAQILCARDLSRCQGGQGKYVAVCNHDGVLINDPIQLKLDEDRYWLSIADPNIWFWARAIAAERGLRVTVSEPDVSPLAVQGPRGEDVDLGVSDDVIGIQALRRIRQDGVKRQQLGVILEGDTPTALGFRSRCVRRDAQLGAQALHRAAQLCHVCLQARDALGGLV